MLDYYVGLDVPYAIALAKAVADFRVLWMEEPVPPDKPGTYRRIKDAVPDILITGGEHEYTRYGFWDFIEKQAVDILQPDIYRAGGMTELKRIAAMECIEESQEPGLLAFSKLEQFAGYREIKDPS